MEAQSPMNVNIVVLEKKKETIDKDAWPASCQICNWKEHRALNYYNRLNTSRFPPTNTRVVEHVRQPFVNVVYSRE